MATNLLSFFITLIATSWRPIAGPGREAWSKARRLIVRIAGADLAFRLGLRASLPAIAGGATNIIFEPGYQQSVVCDSPATPISGDPVRVGKLTGIALTDEGAGGNGATQTSVDFGPMVVDVVVDDNEGTGIAVGDPVYFHDAGTGTGAVHLNNSPTSADAFFGIAQEVVLANATTLIQVFHFPVGLTGTMSGAVGTAQISDASITAAKLANFGTDGLGVVKEARATFDPTGTAGHRTIASHVLGTAIPINATVIGGWLETIVAVDSADHSGTLAVQIEGANDIQTAVNISGAPWSTTGKKAIVPKINTPESTAIKLSAARQITFVVATTALTVGNVIAHLLYVD